MFLLCCLYYSIINNIYQRCCCHMSCPADCVFTSSFCIAINNGITTIKLAEVLLRCRHHTSMAEANQSAHQNDTPTTIKKRLRTVSYAGWGRRMKYYRCRRRLLNISLDDKKRGTYNAGNREEGTCNNKQQSTNEM